MKPKTSKKTARANPEVAKFGRGLRKGTGMTLDKALGRTPPPPPKKRKSEPAVPSLGILTDDKVDRFRDQVLIVLADYQSMDPDWTRHESTRVDIARRIVANLKIIAAEPVASPEVQR